MLFLNEIREANITLLKKYKRNKCNFVNNIRKVNVFYKLTICLNPLFDCWCITKWWKWPNCIYIYWKKKKPNLFAHKVTWVPQMLTPLQQHEEMRKSQVVKCLLACCPWMISLDVILCSKDYYNTPIPMKHCFIWN